MSYQKYDFGDGQMVPSRIHPNGGGMIALTAHVDPTVYVGAGCTVSGHPRITGRVKIVGNCHIFGEKTSSGLCMLIEDDAVISGNVRISGLALIRDQVEVRDNVRISGPVQVMHRARVTNNAVLEGNITVMEQACVTGQTTLISPERATIVRGDHYLNGQRIEHPIRKDSQRKRRVTTLRPYVLDSAAV